MKRISLKEMHMETPTKDWEPSYIYSSADKDFQAQKEVDIIYRWDVTSDVRSFMHLFPFLHGNYSSLDIVILKWGHVPPI